MEYVLLGTTFRGVQEDELVETAKVESVAADHYCILQVKFKLVLLHFN